MKKQTAVLYLANKQFDLFQSYSIGGITAIEYYEQINIVLNQAKEMEKQQIEEAWNSAYGGDSHHEGKDYYTKTFKSE